MSEHQAAAGAYADLALDASGLIYYANETPARDAITIQKGHWQGNNGNRVFVPQPAGYCEGGSVGGQVMALYPRLGVSPSGDVAIAYQRGSIHCLSLVSLELDLYRPTYEIPYGVEPCCVNWFDDHWRWAYIIAVDSVGIRLVIRDIRPDGTELNVQNEPTTTTQGISRINPNGAVILVDNDFLWPSHPDISRPWRSGPFVVGQNNHGDPRDLGYLDGDPKAYRIFDGFAYRPRAVQIGDTWTALCAGDGVVRLIELPPFVADIAEPEPPEPEPEPPKPEPEPPKPEPEPEPMASYCAPNEDLDMAQLNWLSNINSKYFGEQLGCISYGSLSAWHHAYRGWIKFWHDAINKYSHGVPSGDPAMLQKCAQWACRQTGLQMQASFPGTIPDSEIPPDPFR